MRHLNKKGRKFGRKTNVRRSFLKSLLSGLFLNGHIVTTEARGKEIRPLSEKIITVAKKRNLTSRRRLSAILPPLAAKKVYDEIAPRYNLRHGGYVRLVKLEPRRADAARMVAVELV